MNKLHGGQFSGYYKLYHLLEDGSRHVLRRLLRDDTDGLIYIGTSSHIPNRIGSLRKSLLAAYGSAEYRDVSSHIVGRKIVLIPGFTNAFQLNGFYVEPLRTRLSEEDDQWGHYDHEAQQIAEYRAIFGESPPLNG